MKTILTVLFAVSILPSLAQSTADMPSDFLSSQFHKSRREALRKEMPPNSVAVFFANPVRNRSNDVDYLYHQNTDFYYLTGYREPNAVLLIFKDNQTAEDRNYNEIIFVQPRNARSEMWNGRRLGDEGVKATLGFQQVFNNEFFQEYNLDFKKFDQILFFDFENDVRDDKATTADLYDLIEQFKLKVDYASQHKGQVYQREGNDLKVIQRQLNTRDLITLMNKLRQHKTEEELGLLRKAVKVSCAGQIEVMKAIKPGMSEREIQGIHEYVFKKYQAEEVGYPSIVGSGHNGCILHYQENYKPEINSKELILMDLGAEYRGYTADITRTIPISGTFSPEQKQIYELVLAAQEAAMKICKPGTSFNDLTRATKTVINKGLKELGIIKTEDAPHQYYPHGCCHFIGLDVHDRGDYSENLSENMVITIEPGIYIPENADCDKRWWGIAVRIEDDFLITRDGNEHLSASAPRKVAEIEALMKVPSALDDFILPSLDEKRK